jgi:hypothetical protein
LSFELPLHHDHIDIGRMGDASTSDEIAGRASKRLRSPQDGDHPLDCEGDGVTQDEPSHERVWFNLVGRLFSPYPTNPLNHHPLRDILASQIDVEAVRACRALRLFITATNVRTGRARVQPEGPPAGRAASLGLPSAFVPSGGDRRRLTLGRRLYGQPSDLALDLWLRHRGCRARADQSVGA